MQDIARRHYCGVLKFFFSIDSLIIFLILRKNFVNEHYYSRKERKMDKLGKYAVVVGVVVAIIGGFVAQSWVVTALTVLGIIVGLLNVRTKEVKDFLLGTVALVVISSFGANGMAQIPEIGPVLTRIYISLLLFICPAALIVSLKVIYEIAKD